MSNSFRKMALCETFERGPARTDIECSKDRNVERRTKSLNHSQKFEKGTFFSKLPRWTLAKSSRRGAIASAPPLATDSGVANLAANARATASLKEFLFFF